MEDVEEERTEGGQACADNAEVQLNDSPDASIDVRPGCMDQRHVSDIRYSDDTCETDAKHNQ